MVTDPLAERFEADRPHLRAVAYRMLGSLSDAEDAVQEAWIRLQRSDVDGVANLTGWLTTVVGRVCLDMLRSRTSRREEQVPDPVIVVDEGADPEQEAVLADSVGLALLVVLDTLGPAERVAFVLHDLFGVPFDEVGRLVGRSTDAAKMLASRARRRVRGETATPDPGGTARSSTRSSPRAATATSTRWSRCSTRTSCCAPTRAAAGCSCAAPPRWRDGRSCSRSSPGPTSSGCWSTAWRGCSRARTAVRRACSP